MTFPGIHEDSKKRLWVGGVDGFLRWHPRRPRFYSLTGEAKVISEPNVIQHFAEESDGSLLIPLRGRVARFVDGTLKGGYRTALGYRLYWAVYVVPVSWVTRPYLIAIEPFRRFLLYPAMLKRIQRAWRAAYSGHGN